MAEVTVEDRILIRELYDRCYWALNTADGDGVLACFVPGGHVEQYNGNIVTAEQSAAGAVARQEDPVAKTWQHHVTNFIVEPDPEGNENRRAVKLYFLITAVEEPPQFPDAVPPAVHCGSAVIVHLPELLADSETRSPGAQTSDTQAM